MGGKVDDRGPWDIDEGEISSLMMYRVSKQSMYISNSIIKSIIYYGVLVKIENINKNIEKGRPPMQSNHVSLSFYC